MTVFIHYTNLSDNAFIHTYIHTNLHSAKIVRTNLRRLQGFDTVGWAAGRASGLWWGAGVVISLEQGADLHMAQLMPLTLTVSCFSKIRIGFTFLIPLTRVVPN